MVVATAVVFFMQDAGRQRMKMGEREPRSWLAHGQFRSWAEHASSALPRVSSSSVDIAVGMQVAALGYACGRRRVRLAAAAALGVAVTLRFGSRLVSSGQDEVAIRRARHQAELGRQLAIYDRVTGLLSYWFLALRGDEECHRSARYEAPLTVVVVETHPDSNADVQELSRRFASSVREVDSVGYFGNGRFVSLMPNTDLGQAAGVRNRLTKIGFGDCATATYGMHGTSFDELYQAALARVSVARLGAVEKPVAT